jgi:hypothetical protein
MTMKKLNCLHVDTCLPCYWGGHHLPHVQVPVSRNTTVGEVRAEIISELNQGAACGAEYDIEDDAWHKAAIAAVRRDVKMRKKGARHPFRDLEDEGDDCESVYAFFVFTDEEK